MKGKTKGEQADLATTCSSKVEEMGERLGHGTELVPPIKEEKSTIEFYNINIKDVLTRH